MAISEDGVNLALESKCICLQKYHLPLKKPFVISDNRQGDDDSPASFEKTLSNLSTKITRTTTKLEKFRQRSRRYNILWILYSTILYLLYSLILLLVVGWRNWRLLEIVAIISGPILLVIDDIGLLLRDSLMICRIYSVRVGIVSYYNFRISKSQAQLDEVKRQRDTVIERLKTATKYNTTQELLQKYGGAPATRNKSEGASQGKANAAKGDSGAPQVRRTGILPPPTANIPRHDGTAPVWKNEDLSASGSSGSYRLPPSSLSAESSPKTLRVSSSPQAETAEFAPNAFSAVPQYAQSTKGPRWFDRLMDVILGEDESLPSNRIALICKQCRLVNGQAPPGTKRLEEVGRWRCTECGTMNGEETEVNRILAGFKEEAPKHQKSEKGSSPKGRQNLGRSTTREDDDDEDISKVEAVVDSEESDITQYSSDASSDHDHATTQAQVPSNSSNTKHPAGVSEESPPPTTTAAAAAATEEEPLRRRAGRPKGSKNKRS